MCNCLCCVGWWSKEGRRWNLVPTHSLLFSKSTRTVMYNLALRKCTSPPLLALRLKIYYSAGDRTPDLLNQRQTSYCLSQRSEWIECVYHDKIISRDLWPARSPDLTPCNLYLRGRLKYAVYKTNPRTLEELKCNIRDEINNINRELQRVMGNFIKRCQKWLDNEGGQFQQLRQ